MELMEVFWCMFGLIIGFVCCHLAHKGTEDDGDNQRDSEGELDRDSDIRIYLPKRIRMRCGNYGYYKRLEAEEKGIVFRVILHDYDRTLSPKEKETLQKIIEECDEECELMDRADTEEDAEGILTRLDQAVAKFDEAITKWRGAQ